MLGQGDEAEQDGLESSIERALKGLRQRYQVGALTTAAAMAQIAELLQITRVGAEAGLPLLDKKNLSNGYQFCHTEHNGFGWQAGSTVGQPFLILSSSRGSSPACA